MTRLQTALGNPSPFDSGGRSARLVWRFAIGVALMLGLPGTTFAAELDLERSAGVTPAAEDSGPVCRDLGPGPAAPSESVEHLMQALRARNAALARARAEGRVDADQPIPLNNRGYNYDTR